MGDRTPRGHRLGAAPLRSTLPKQARTAGVRALLAPQPPTLVGAHADVAHPGRGVWFVRTGIGRGPGLPAARIRQLTQPGERAPHTSFDGYALAAGRCSVGAKPAEVPMPIATTRNLLALSALCGLLC